MTKDMTQGNALKLILQFALPLLIGNILQQTYNVIDAAIVGRYLGAEALGGVGASTSIQFMVIGFCMGLCNGFSVPVARDFGAGDHKRMRKDIFHAYFLLVVFAVVLTLLCTVFCTQILHILSVPDNIFHDAYAYLFVIFAGIPFTLLYNLLAGILRAVGDSRTPFIFLAISSGLNIILDIICIVVFQWGCAGAAIATVTAQAISGISCLILIIKKYHALRLNRTDCVLAGEYVREMLGMGVPMGLQFSITAIGSMVMQSANNSLGSIFVSGFAAAAKIKMFLMSPIDALSTGVSVFCSQNLGARKLDRIKEGWKKGTVIGVAYGVLAGMCMIFFGRHASLLFISGADVAVLDASAKYLKCMGFFFWSLGILNVCRLTVQGLGFSGRAVFSGVTEMFARIIVSFGFVATYGYTAICFADQSAWITATIYIVITSVFCLRKIAKDLDKPVDSRQNAC